MQKAFDLYVRDQWDQGRDVEYMGWDALSLEEKARYLFSAMTMNWTLVKSVNQSSGS